MGIIVKGPAPSLTKLKLMIEGFADIQLIYTRRSSSKLWITSRRPQQRRRPPSKRREPKQPEDDVYIGGEIYPRQEIERIASEWQRNYIIA